MHAVKLAFGNRGFLACLGMLLVFTVSFRAYVAASDIQFSKLPLELKKPLDRLDHAKLAPYKLLRAESIPSEMLDALGTTEYIQWLLQDASPGQRGQADSLVQLFVTYYTGTPDQVPHVPEECYLGSGFSVDEDQLIDVEIPGLGDGVTIPVRVLEFERSAMTGLERRIVMYTFHANGQFRSGRKGVQILVANPRTRHAYFSKLELAFGNPQAPPSKEASIEAGKRFLQTVVPVLVRDHWPDFEAAEAALAAAEKPSSG